MRRLRQRVRKDGGKTAEGPHFAAPPNLGIPKGEQRGALWITCARGDYCGRAWGSGTKLLEKQALSRTWLEVEQDRVETSGDVLAVALVTACGGSDSSTGSGSPQASSPATFILSGSTPAARFQSLLDGFSVANDIVNLRYKATPTSLSICKESATIEVRFRNSLATIQFDAAQRADVQALTSASLAVSAAYDRCALAGAFNPDTLSVPLDTRTSAKKKLKADLGL